MGYQFEKVGDIAAQDTATGIQADLRGTEQVRLDGMKNWGGNYCLGGRSD